MRLALSRGHQVAGLIIPSEAVPQNVAGGAAPVWLRGTLDQAPWDQIAAFRPEVCVHTAWITAPGVYLESPENESFRDTSLTFLRRLVGYGTGHIVSLGTCIEYQISDQPLAEDRTPVNSTTTYARCKDQLRRALEAEAAKRGFVLCWGRVFYPYGPGEHPSRLCSSLAHRLLRGERVSLKTPDSTKDYIYIEDLASALLTVVEVKFAGTINLGTGTGVAVRQIAGSLGKLLGRPELVESAQKPEPDPFPHVVANAGRLKGLGWQPAWTMERGLEQVVKAVQRG